MYCAQIALSSQISGYSRWNTVSSLTDQSLDEKTHCCWGYICCCCMLKLGAFGLSPYSFFWACSWWFCSSMIGLNFMLWNKLIFLLASTTIGAWPPCMPNPAWLNLLWGCILGLTDWGALPRDNFLLSSEAGFVFLGGGAVSSITWKNQSEFRTFNYFLSLF